MKIDNKTAKRLKKDFPIFKKNFGLVYLDNAATSHKPKEVIRGIGKFYSEDYANIHRGVYKLSHKATELYMKSKEIVAKFINSSPEEIIYTRNTTESLNFLSYVLPKLIKSNRKEIVLSEMEHHSNLIPWQQLAKRHKFKLKFIKVDKDTLMLDLEDANKKITSKTAIVSLVHVSNALGAINPAKEIFKMAKKKGAFCVLDAAQSVPHMSIDVKQIDCDFLAFSGHKILGPSGIGVLYGKKELLKKMEPFQFGGEMIKKVTKNTALWAEIPRKFEAGTPNITGAIGLGISIKYLQNIGVDNVEEWEKKLTDYTLERFLEIPEIKTYTPKKYSGIISFNIEGVHPHDVASLLDKDKITIRAGHHCTMPLMKKLGLIGKGKGGTCRVSFNFYNTFQDVDKLVKALKKVVERFE